MVCFFLSFFLRKATASKFCLIQVLKQKLELIVMAGWLASNNLLPSVIMGMLWKIKHV